MNNGPLAAYQDILKRLNSDLESLESIAGHLKNVKSYVTDVRKIDLRIASSVSELHAIVKKELDRLNKIAQITDSNLRELTDNMSDQLKKIQGIDIPGKFKDLSGKVDQLDQYMQKADTILTTVNKSMDNTAQKVNMFESRLRDADRSLTLLQSEVKHQLETSNQQFQKDLQTIQLQNQHLNVKADTGFKAASDNMKATTKKIVDVEEKIFHSLNSFKEEVKKRIVQTQIISIVMFVILLIVLFILR